MALLSVKCPYCGSTKVVKFGKHTSEAQDMLDIMKDVHASVFQPDYKYHTCEPGVKFHILEMTINGSKARDISVYSHKRRCRY